MTHIIGNVYRCDVRECHLHFTSSPWHQADTRVHFCPACEAERNARAREECQEAQRLVKRDEKKLGQRVTAAEARGRD